MRPLVLSLCLHALLLGALTSCTTGKPEKFIINGKTRIHTPKKIIGITYNTVVEDVLTKEQEKDRLEIEKERREQELDLQAEERQSAAVFWIGLALVAFLPVAMAIGYVTKGWKFWGGIGVSSGILGICFWSFQHLVPYLKWGGVALVASIILWSMWKLKDFDLIEKIKNSDKGKLIG